MEFQHQSFQCRPLFPCPYGPAQGSREQAERTVGGKLFCGLEGSLSLLRVVCVSAPCLPSHTSHSRQAEPALLPHQKAHHKPWFQKALRMPSPGQEGEKWPRWTQLDQGVAHRETAGVPHKQAMAQEGGAGRCAWRRLAHMARGQGRFSFLASTHLRPVLVLSI